MAALREGGRDLHRRHRSDLTVVIAAGRNGIDVRAEHQWRSSRFTARAPADQVPGAINPHVEIRALHQCGNPATRSDIGVAVREAVRSSVRCSPEPREFPETPV